MTASARWPPHKVGVTPRSQYLDPGRFQTPPRDAVKRAHFAPLVANDRGTTDRDFRWPDVYTTATSAIIRRVVSRGSRMGASGSHGRTVNGPTEIQASCT